MTKKKIIIIDGGPRKTFNTASMLKKFAEGANSVSDSIEVKTYRLYDTPYKGCMSCMACKIKDVRWNYCLKAALGEPEHIIAYNTYQVKNYDRYELAGFSEEGKKKYRDEHWEQDLQSSFDAGRRMAEHVV